MKKITFLFAFICIITSLFSQSNRKVDAQGNFLWQWHRSVAVLEEENKLAVTFVFINGIQHQAIAYRQEHFFSEFIWKDTTNGVPFIDGDVKCIQANLSPNSAVSWTFHLQGKTLPSLENAAILFIDEKYEVTKERIAGNNY